MGPAASAVETFSISGVYRRAVFGHERQQVTVGDTLRRQRHTSSEPCHPHRAGEFICPLQEFRLTLARQPIDRP